MAEVLETTSPKVEVAGLTRILPTDIPRLSMVLSNAWRVRELWDDSAKENPGLWFMSNYASPFNLLFDVLDGAGLVAFLRVVPGWRAQVYAAAWARRAKGRDDLFRQACQIAMLTHDLLVIDSFVRVDNRISQKATLRTGFKNRGIIKAAQQYNGAGVAMYWNELDRQVAGLGE